MTHLTKCGWCPAETEDPHFSGWAGFGPILSDEPSPEVSWLCPFCMDNEPPHARLPQGCQLIVDDDAPARFAVWSAEGDIIGTGEWAADAIEEACTTVAAWETAGSVCATCHATRDEDEIEAGKCIACMLHNLEHGVGAN